MIECGDVKLESSLSQKEYRRRVKQLRRQVGTVFQHFYLFPHLDVVENITEAPVHVLRHPKQKAEIEANQLLESVGLKYAAGRYPESLSGGEQQRVAIARALAMRPDLLLFDEPTSALDPKRTSELRALLRDFATHGHTMVIVSHSLSFLEGAADYMLYLEAGEVVEQGPTKEVLNSPKDPRTKEFIRHAG
jgi:ABC-type polar amino acid transport system ATPase subunit